MEKLIHDAIACLETFKLSPAKQAVSAQCAFEAKRRSAYVDNLVRQLMQLARDPNLQLLALIMDEIKEALAHDFYPVLVEEDANILAAQHTMNTALGRSLEYLEKYQVHFSQLENARTKLQQCFTDMPVNINNTVNIIANICYCIESELNFYHTGTIASTKDVLHNYKKGKYSQVKGADQWCKLQLAYWQAMQQSHLASAANNVFSAPVQLVIEPNLEVATETRARPNTYAGLYIAQCYLNVAANLFYYYKQLNHFRELTSIESVKQHIKAICRLQAQLALNIKYILEQQPCYRNKIVQYDQQGLLSGRDEMIAWLRFMDKLTKMLHLFSNHLNTLKEISAWIFAYVLDESTTRISKRYADSRLDLLLVGKEFVPLDEETIVHAYEKHALQASVSLHPHVARTTHIAKLLDSAVND